MISEIKTNGDIIRTFDHLVNNRQGLKTWFPFHMAVANDERIFVCDYSPDGQRVLLLNHGSGDLVEILNSDRNDIARPSRLCYLPETQRLVVGQGRTQLSTHPSSLSIFHTLLRDA